MSELVERLREGTTIRLSETASTYTPPPKLQTEAADRIEALERERDEAQRVAGQNADLWHEACAMVEETRAASQAEASRLREALTPFADVADFIASVHPGWDHDQFVITDYLNLAPFRAARAALEKP